MRFYRVFAYICKGIVKVCKAIVKILGNCLTLKGASFKIGGTIQEISR